MSVQDVVMQPLISRGQHLQATELHRQQTIICHMTQVEVTQSVNVFFSSTPNIIQNIVETNRYILEKEVY